MAWSGSLQRPREMRLSDKVWQSNWGMIFVIALISSFGFAMLYSAANGSWDPWASRQVVRFAVGLVMLFCVAFIDIRHWFRYAYLFYFLALGLLVAVEVMQLLIAVMLGMVVATYYAADIYENVIQLFHKEIGFYEGSIALDRTFSGRWNHWETAIETWLSFSLFQQMFGSGIVALGAHNDYLLMKSNTFPSNFQRVSINDSCWS